MSAWNQAVLFSTALDEDAPRNRWMTDRAIVSQCRELGGETAPYVLDAAARSNSSVTDHYYGLDSGPGCLGNARSRSWGDDARACGGWRVWLNPPYGRHVGDWLKLAELQARDGNLVIDVLPLARTDTAWWHDVVMHHETWLYRGRLTFLNPETGQPVLDKKGRPQPCPAPSALVRIRARRLPSPIIHSLERPQGAVGVPK